VVPRGWSSRRVVCARRRVGVLHAHLRLQSIRVPEEEAEDVAEVGDEAIRRAASEQPPPDLVERFDGGRLQSEVVVRAQP